MSWQRALFTHSTSTRNSRKKLCRVTALRDITRHTWVRYSIRGIRYYASSATACTRPCGFAGTCGPSRPRHLLSADAKQLLRQHSYVALKIFVSSTSYETQAQREIQVSQHLNHVKTQHAGRAFVRTIRDQFVVTGPNGQHHCFVHTPLSVKLSYLHALMPRERFPSKVLRSFVWHMLTALDFLHSDAGVIHGGASVLASLLSLHDFRT
jgi:serine/threonine protein kinase